MHADAILEMVRAGRSAIGPVRLWDTTGWPTRDAGEVPDFNPRALIEDLRHVRRNGYALDREEFNPGVICVGAAIRDHSGAVVGAISASAPTMRTTEDHLALMREEVVAATRALSAELGGLDTAERPLASVAAFDDFVGRYADIGFTDLVFHHPRADDPVWDEPESIVDEIATDVLPRWRS